MSSAQIAEMPVAEAAPVETPAAAPQATRRTQQFRRSVQKVALSVDQKRRQATVTAAAWKAYGARDGMIAFLNTHDDALGGRRLDLAVDSDTGLTAVLAKLDATTG